MEKTLTTIRIFFFLLIVAGSYLTSYTIPEWDEYRILALFIGGLIGLLVILVDIFLKGFSLRGLSAITFGLLVGWVCAQLITTSPFFDLPFDKEDRSSALFVQNAYLVRLAVFVIMMYLGTVIALRGKDEFNLVIPYIRFVPHGVDVPIAVVDTSALIDGRIVGICESKFMGYALVIPRFVINELQEIADSPEPDRKARGRKGLDALNRLREMKGLDLRINDSSVSNRQSVDAKLIFLAQSLKGRLLTTDYNLAQIAEFHNVEWLNLNSLTKALTPDLVVGEKIEVNLMKQGKEPNQAVGYLEDGSMVVVTNGRQYIGQKVVVMIDSVIPSAGGKMIFGSITEQ